MKREALRINDYTGTDPYGTGLRRISLLLPEQECTGFLGLSSSGKDHLIHLLTGRKDPDFEKMKLSIRGERIRSAERLTELVCRMHPDNYRVRDWSVAEYAALVRAGWLLMGKNRRRMREEVQALLDRICPGMLADTQLQDLSPYEKRMADLAKTCLKGAGVLVIEDDLEDLRAHEQTAFAAQMRRIAREYHFTVIVSSHSYEVIRLLCDQLIFFRDGRIVRKCRAAAVAGRGEIERYLLGAKSDAQKSLEDYIRGQSGEEPGEEYAQPVYRVRGLPVYSDTGKTHPVDLNFSPGSITTLLVMNEAQRMRLFDNISGRDTDREVYCVIGDRRLSAGEYEQFVRAKVVSILRPGSREELFRNMSVSENLLLPSLEKISGADYLFESKSLINAVDDSPTLPADREAMMGQMDVNDRIAVVMERWLLYNPKVLVLMDPFERCDLYGVSMVRSYILRFASIGAAVIVLRVRDEYMEDISDEIIRL